MTLSIPEIPADQLDRLVQAMNTTGYAVVPHFLDSAEMASIRDFVIAAIRRAGGDYAGFIGPAAVAGSGLDVIAEAPPFRALMRGVYERGRGQPGPDQNFYQVLRCLSGPGAAKHAYYFHYDSYLVTALLPVEIPASGQAGDLLVLPNTRRVRRHYILNVLDKIMLDNPVSQFVLKTLVRGGRLRYRRVQMIPGNLYLFWGYRSIHANEPCDPTRVRATALFHYGNPHNRSALAAPPTPVAETAA